MTPIRILAVDDHPAITGWIRSVCERSDAFELIGEYSSFDAVPIPDRAEADIIIVDLILEATGDLWPGLIEVSTWGRKIVVFSVRTEGAVVSRALHHGASAFVGKGATERQMTSALELVAEGATGLVIAADSPTELPSGLTPSLEALLGAITKTTDTAELANMLNYDKHTIEVYIGRLYDVLNTQPRNRAALVAQAEALGF